MILRVFLFSLMMSLALPQFASANSCSSLFHVKSSFSQNLKSVVLARAVSQTKIKLTEDRAYINKILDRWNLENSTPQKVEEIAQALVLRLDKKRTFLQWLKEIILKGEPLKEATRVRAETLLLARELNEGLETRGFLKNNSVLDNYRAFRQEHYNKIQLTKLLLINSITINYLGIPLYFPNFDWVKNLDIKPEDLDLVQRKGFENSYRIIAEKYKKQLMVQRTIEHAPQVFFLSVITYTAYNYLRFEAQEARYDVSVEETIPQSHVLFKEWQREYEVRTGQQADLKNPEAKREWDITVLSIYRAWADLFHEKEGRYPDLSNPKDHKAWEEFLATIQP